MTRQRVSAFSLFCLVVTLLVCRDAQAAIALSDPVTLSDLINNQGSVMAGDKQFDQFTFDASGDMPASDAVLVGAIENDGDYGIRISGGFDDFAGDGPSLLTVTYRVRPVDSAMGIVGARLAGNPSVDGIVTMGSFTINESFSGLPQSLEIFDAAPGSTKLLDTTTFDDILSELTVQVSLDANTTSEIGGVTASFVDNTFSQSVVPEPASVVVWIGVMAAFCVTPLVMRRKMVPVRVERETR